MFTNKFYDLGGVFGDINPDFTKSGNLTLGCALAIALDNRSGMAHTLFGGGIDTGDIGHHGFSHPAVDILGSFFFLDAADFTDDDYGISAGVFFKEAENFRHIGEDYGIGTNTDDGTLAVTAFSQVDTDFIGQSAAAGNNADAAGGEHICGEDADLGFAGGDNTGTGRPDDLDGAAVDMLPDLHDILDRDVLGYNNDQFDTGVDVIKSSLLNGRWGHEEDGCFDLLLLYCFSHGIIDRDAFDDLTAFTRRDTSDNVSAVIKHPPGLSTAGAAGDTLYHNPGLTINKNTHSNFPRKPIVIFR